MKNKSNCYEYFKFNRYEAEIDKKNVITIYPVLKSDKDFKYYDSSNGIEDIDVLISLANLHKKSQVNNYKDFPLDFKDWCEENIQPFGIKDLNNLIKLKDYNVNSIVSASTFKADVAEVFATKIGWLFEYWYMISQSIRKNKEKLEFENLKNTERIVEYPYLTEMLIKSKNVNDFCKLAKKQYNLIIKYLLYQLNPFKAGYQFNESTKTIELKCEYNNVFDIARFGFIRLIVENIDSNKDIPVLTCANCGDYVVRHSSRTIYCQKKECQNFRNRIKQDRSKQKSANYLKYGYK